MTIRSHIARASLLAVLAALPAIRPAPAAAQNPTVTNVVPQSAALTLHARITAINPEKRWVTLASASGEQVTVIAGPAVRLDMLKVGDRVNARYYRAVGFLVTPPAGGSGVPVSNDEIAGVLARPAKTPGGEAVQVTRVSGTVVGLDLAENKVDLVNPSGGGIYSFIVTDPARIPMLGALKIGDTITVVLTEAFAVTIDPAPQGWF